MAKLFKWIGLGFLVLVLAVALVPFIGMKIDNIGSKKRGNWLSAHAVYQGDVSPDIQFNFPEAFYANRLFLMGEVHGFAPQQQIDLALVKHLSKKVGLRFYLAELSPHQAMAFNHFLSSGDAAPSRAVFDEWAEQKAQWGNQEFFQKLKDLRAFNATLDPDKRIFFIGIDKPDVASSLPTPDPLDLSGSAAIADAVNHKLFEAAQSREKAGRYGHILPNLKLVLNDPRCADEPLYGLSGAFHTMQTKVNGQTPWILSAKTLPALEGQIVTLSAIAGPGSAAMVPSAFVPGPLQGPSGEEFVALPMSNDNPYLSYLSGLGDLKQASADNTLSVLAVDGEETPYLKGKRLIKMSGVIASMQKFDVEGPTSAALDYVIYLEGAAPVTPWSGRMYNPATKEITGD